MPRTHLKFAFLMGAMFYFVNSLPCFAQDKTIVLQSYAYKPSQNSQYYVDLLARTFEKDGLLYGQALSKLVDHYVSYDPGPINPIQNLKNNVAEGRRQFIEGEYLLATKLLDYAYNKLIKYPALLANDQNLHKSAQQSLLFLAHAYLRLGKKDEAIEQIRILLRNDPNLELAIVEYGPELVQFYQQVRTTWREHRRYSLTINTLHPGCLAFLNERFVGLTPTRVDNLYPGTYRIYLQQPEKPGRVHTVELSKPNTSVSLDFQLDRVLKTKPHVGFLFQTIEQLEGLQIESATKVGRLIGAKQVILFSITKHKDLSYLQGTTISMSTGHPKRIALLALEPNPPLQEDLRALGHFLVDGKITSKKTFVQKMPLPATEQKDSFFSARVFRWITLGIAVAAVSSGSVLWAMNGNCTESIKEGVRCQKIYDTFSAGIGLTIGGGISAVTSGVLFYISMRNKNNTEDTATITPWFGHGIVGISALGKF